MFAMQFYVHHVCAGTLREERALDVPELDFVDSCEPLDVSAGNQNQVFYKSCQSS